MWPRPSTRPGGCWGWSRSRRRPLATGSLWGGFTAGAIGPRSAGAASAGTRSTRRCGPGQASSPSGAAASAAGCCLVKPAFDPEVFRARFALLRRGDTLTDTDRDRLATLFDAHPRLEAASQALQELHGLYTADDHQGALEALGRFYDLYETGELPEFHDTVDTFIARSDEILAWHHSGRASNGRIEGRQQPATSPATHRPRLHQPRQLRSPRHPRDIMNPPVPATLIPRNRAAARLSGWFRSAPLWLPER